MNVHINVPRSEVIRYLGYPKDRNPSRQVFARLELAWDEALALLEPRGCHRVVNQAEAQGTGMPDPSRWVGLAACTVGDKLMNRIVQLSDEGDALGALLFDAFGSAAAEATADIFSKILCNEATKLGLFAQQRISPGYGLWSTASQENLFSLLQAESAGMKLTTRQMMEPRKSVSFGMRFLDRPGENDHKGCRTCTMKNCEYRLEEAL